MRTSFSCTRRGLVLVLIASATATGAYAQGTAEYAGSISNARKVHVRLPGLTTSQTKIPNASKSATHVHLSPRGERLAEENLKKLEGKAGKRAAKLLLRSKPANARIWIDGNFVGTTPLLLILAPGSYEVELLGSPGEFAKQEISLLPEEHHDLTIPLHARYRTSVVIP